MSSATAMTGAQISYLSRSGEFDKAWQACREAARAGAPLNPAALINFMYGCSKSGRLDLVWEIEAAMKEWGIDQDMCSLGLLVRCAEQAGDIARSSDLRPRYEDAIRDYEEHCAAEDIALAEEGMADYAATLKRMEQA